MKKRRTQSLYASVRHHSKQHCPEDLCCNPCCSCVQTLKKANKILMEKNMGLGREKEEYIREIMRLNKVVKGWEKREREFKDLEEVKRRLREEIKGEFQDKRRVDDMIIKEKLASGKKERDGLLREKEELLDSVTQFELKFQRVTKEYRALEQKHKKMQSELEGRRKEIQKNEELIGEMKKRSSELEGALKDKTEVIGRLEKSLNTSQQNYLLQKAKRTDHQLELMVKKQQIGSATKSIQSLKKQAEEKSLSIKELATKNTKLDHLVRSLDQTVNSYSVLQEGLRNRILVSEGYAVQKQIQVKQLQCDYFDVLYRKSI